MVHQMKRKTNPIVEFIKENEGKFSININGRVIVVSKTEIVSYSDGYLYIVNDENNCKSVIKLDSIDSVITIDG